MNVMTDYTFEYKNDEYMWWSDPGHSWLQVPLVTTTNLDISSYSYRDAHYAYLEEDRDAGLWFAARGYTPATAPHYRASHTNEDSPIRAKARFC
jgi:hypothetical protein